MKKRITEIEIERRETFIVSPPRFSVRPFCPECAAAMLLPAEFSAVARIGLRGVFRLIEQNAVHFVETDADAIYVCARSFAAPKI